MIQRGCPTKRTRQDAVPYALLAMVVLTFSAVLCLAYPLQTAVTEDVRQWFGYPVVAGLVVLCFYLCKVFIESTKFRSPSDSPNAERDVNFPKEGLELSNYPRPALKVRHDLPRSVRAWIVALSFLVTALIYAVTNVSNPEVFLLLGAISIGSAVWSLVVDP